MFLQNQRCAACVKARCLLCAWMFCWFGTAPHAWHATRLKNWILSSHGTSCMAVRTYYITDTVIGRDRRRGLARNFQPHPMQLHHVSQRDVKAENGWGQKQPLRESTLLQISQHGMVCYVVSTLFDPRRRASMSTLHLCIQQVDDTKPAELGQKRAGRQHFCLFDPYGRRCCGCLAVMTGLG